MSKDENKIKLTKVSILHYVRLIYRSALLIVALLIYLKYKLRHDPSITTCLRQEPWIIAIIWLVYVVEMILRFFPSVLESPGCQKQFKCNYIKTGNIEIKIQDNNATILVALVWIAFNGLFGALHMAGLFDDDIMILLCCAYAVCDMICILFYCPFQSWFLKNKCCATCRIYNWDYAMMFTPLFFVKGFFSWSLLVLSVGLLVRWEITIFKYPERFAESTNGYLNCANCTEKLCVHKKHLIKHRRRIAEFTRERISKLK